ncbi:transcription elongation regulator 1-like protein [Alosa pseudoharengus]|uniref:transcription elongation regulator 1-like protein n=1 Tax=Alosa pseudoharengus TaxID=34774 RepID=UPI003F8CD0E2
MIPVPRLKGQSQLWQMNAEPPPWVWMIPSGSGLCRVGAAVPAPLLLSARPPPLLQGLSSWQLSCDPLIPLIRIPPTTEPAIHQFPLQNVQFDLPSRPHVLGFQPSASVELVPVFPRVYRTVLPPHFRKGWVEKRLPEYKVYLNNTLALETTWLGPEEIGIFQRQEKPLLVTNQMAMSISRPASASRNFHTLLVSPRRISGCPVAIKRVRSNKRIALAAAAMMAMESEVAQGPSASSAHPLHLLSLSPIKIPFLSPHRPGVRATWEGLLGPVLPAQIGRVASLTAPGVALVAGDWKEQGPTAYHSEIIHLENWCRENNLELNTSKTKELIVDFSRKQQRSFLPLSILRLSGSIMAWMGNTTKRDQLALRRVVRSAEWTMKTTLPNLQDIYIKHCRSLTVLNWTDKKLDMVKPPRAGALVLHTDQKAEDKRVDKPFKISLAEESAPKDQRPVASTPVPGSPWCVVWTGDDRVFFFNPTMQLSVWDRPVDLKDRGDLKRIMEDPPHKRKKDSSSKDGSSSLSADDDDDEDEHNSKTKRNKVEEPEDSGLDAIDKEPATLSGTSPAHMVLPLELRIAHFRDMLLERGVSAFSTWEKELHKIVFDPRYLLLSSEERKQIFDQFVKARIKEEYKERKSKLQQAKEEYRKLLEESKITSRSTFKEFSEKYGRDQRFKQVLKKKDQELFFNQFVNALKKRDKENRMRLRKMR